MASEFIVPGVVIVFPGLAAVTVGLLLALGIIRSFTVSLTLWFSLSLFYVLVLRWFIMKLFPSDSRKVQFQEDRDMAGKVVTVIVEIPENGRGRIRYRDSSWTAEAEGETIETGARVRLVSIRDNVWTVERVRE